MVKKLSLFALNVLLSISAFAQIPQGYYDGADGKKKAELKSALYDIVSPHVVISYSALWDAYEITDVVPGTTDQVYDMFSLETAYYSSRGTEINREHVVPKSWWGGGSNYNSYSDLFNVIPSNAQANSAKSNYPLGEITGSVSFDNGRTRVGKADQSGGAPYVFEPADEFKGDFARIYMYVATCYQNISWEEKYYAFNAGVNEYPTLKAWIIPMLLEWNRQDPVSDREIERQKAVYGIQKNRNPFIDYPILAEFIWGDSVSVAFDLATAIPNVGQQGGDEGGSGGDDTPDDGGDPNPGGGEGDDDDETTPDDTPAIAGDMLFVETFDDIEGGNDTSTGGSNSAWSGNDSIASVTAAYSAGGAVRVGTSKKAGSITTVPLDYDGGDIVVEVDVKGWSTVEGELLVTASGCPTQTLTYSAKMADGYETLKIAFKGVSASPEVKFETSKKRCFISAIRIYEEKSANSIDKIESVRSADDYYYTLSGQRLPAKPHAKGLYIHQGKKFIVR